MFHIQMWVLVGTWGGVMCWSDIWGQLDMRGRRLPVDCKLIRHYGSLRWEELNTKETIKRKKNIEINKKKLIQYWNFLSSEKYSILFHWNLQQLLLLIQTGCIFISQKGFDSFDSFDFVSNSIIMMAYIGPSLLILFVWF